jgi:hypothetical protein
MRSADVAEKLERIRAQKEFARAREELEELKRRRRGLVPIELFTATADGSANGNPSSAD